MSCLPLLELLHNPWESRLFDQLSEILEVTAESITPYFDKLVQKHEAELSDRFSIIFLDPTQPGHDCRPLATITYCDDGILRDQAEQEAAIHSRFGMPRRELRPYQLAPRDRGLTISDSAVLDGVIAACAGLATRHGNHAMAEFVLRHFTAELAKLFGPLKS